MTIAGVFALFMAFGAYYSGALAHLFYGPKLPADLLGPKGPIFDKIMPHFITTSGLPVVLVMIIVLMVFSASMSSLSSLVLVSSSAVAIDIFGAFTDKERDAKSTMVLLRVLCAVFVGISLAIALLRPTLIMNLMVMSWGTLLGVFLAPYVYGLFWRRTTRAGVWAGMVAGLATAVSLFVAWGADGVPLAGAVAMLVPLLVVPAVSLFTRAPEEKALTAAFGEPQAGTDSTPPGLAPGV
jgi:Na+/proline symporter